MLFQSQEFCLVFLPLAVIAYYVCAGSPSARQWILILASLIFYSWWDVRFLPLLLVQISATWLLAGWAHRFAHYAFLALAIALNLLALATFKYLDFLVVSLETAFGISLPRLGLVLPIGISFFSFQLISYIIDRKRGDAPLYPFRSFALFVLLFPHLIAGPIVRHNELIPQFALDPRRAGMWMRIATGLTLLTIGIAKKILLADKLAIIADRLFAKAAQGAVTSAEAWNGALAFTFQLFLDFSAYTEMAIGIALIFGLILPENFKQPYLASDLRQFWRRWHISLSLFLRDYLFIPLGGSRQGWPRYVLATLVTMALCGLWHGAGWNYVAWGLIHGFGLVLCQAWQRAGGRLPLPLAWLLTMLFVIAGWVVFRANDFATASHMLVVMAGFKGFSGPFSDFALIAFAAVLSLALPSAYDMKDRYLKPNPWRAGALSILAIYCVAEIGRGPPQAFIYFRF